MTIATEYEEVKVKKSFKIPTVYTILFIIIALVALLTWIMPAGKYDYRVNGTDRVIPASEVLSYEGSERLLPIPGTYTELESSPQGAIDVLMAPIKGFHKAVDVALFVLVIGGFLAITMESGAMDSGVAAIVRKFQGREQMMIPALVFMFALGGSTYGMAEETVAFWAVILPVMVVAGYDRMVAAGIILLGSGVGVLASTVNPFATGIASGFADLPIGEGIGLRLIQFIIFTTMASWYVMRYAAKVKEDKANSVLNDIEFDDEFSNFKEGDGEFTTKQKLTMFVFFGTFLVMIYGVIPWADMGITAIPTLWWWFDELSTLFLAAAILIALINQMSECNFIKTFIEGSKDLIGVALIVAIARGISVVMENGVIIDTILNWAEGLVTGLPSGAFVVVTYLVHILLSFFIPSTSGLATVSMPLMAPLADFSGIGRDLIVTAYQCGTGLIHIFSPTAGHLVAGLALANIPYERFFKWSLPFVIMVLLVSIITLFIGTAMA